MVQLGVLDRAWLNCCWLELPVSGVVEGVEDWGPEDGAETGG